MEARRAGRLLTSMKLATGRTTLQIIDVVNQANQTAEQAVSAAHEREPPNTISACQVGCSWCCYKTVGTVAPEALRIAAYLKQTRSAEDFETLRDRIIRLDEERRALPAGEKATARPCSLLAADQCAAYPVRPMTCRGFNSSDAHQCRLALDPRNHAVVPSYAPQQRLHTFVLDGVRAGLDESGLSGDLLELTAALRVALTVPDAEAQWLAGKAVFARARLD